MNGKRSSLTTPTASTIFARMTQLAQETGAINLGQGFPDSDGPQAVLEAAREAITAGVNQYPPARGDVALRSAVAAHQRRRYGLDVAPDTQVLVTTGATEAIATAILALVKAGDEVVMFEPYYDSYAAMVTMAGGVRRTVPLRFPDFGLDERALEAAFSERTAVVLINTPHNPTGKVFAPDELGVIARLAARHDAVVLSDEVYEHLTFDGHPHTPIATLPGMADRTLTIGSGGKTFSTTGWKIGWVSGPADLVALLVSVKQFLTFSGGAPLQPAIAVGLGLPDAFFTNLRADMAARRDLLQQGLERAGFVTARPAGGYFVLADGAAVGAQDAEEFALSLPREAGVVAVPASVFCDDAAATNMRSVLRFAFCKQSAVIEEAVRRLVERYGRSR